MTCFTVTPGSNHENAGILRQAQDDKTVTTSNSELRTHNSQLTTHKVTVE